MCSGERSEREENSKEKERNRGRYDDDVVGRKEILVFLASYHLKEKHLNQILMTWDFRFLIDPGPVK